MANRVVVIVDGGVADYVSDPNINVLVIDIDDLRAGDMVAEEDVDAFSDLIPEWVHQTITVVKEEF